MRHNSYNHRSRGLKAPVAVIGAASMLLAACGSGSTTASSASSATSGGSNTSGGKAASTTPSAHKVTLTFWNAYNEQDAEASTMAKVIIPKFEKAHPNIVVKSVVYPYSALLSKLLASVSAGDPPNIVRSDIIWVPQLANIGALLPLSKKLPGFTKLAGEVFSGPLSTNKWHGAYYGLPLDTNTQALFWNKTAFAAAHLSGPPKTMTQLFADAKALTNPARHQYGLGVDGTDMWNVAPYIWSMGGHFKNSTVTKATGYMNGPQTLSAVNQLVTAYKQGYVGKDFLGGPGTISGEQGFPKGTYAMYLDGPWAVPTYSSSKPALTYGKQYGIAQVPSGSAGSISTVGGEDVVIPSGAKHVADTELFLKFLMSPFSQLAMAKAGQMSVLRSLSSQETSLDSYYAPFATQLKTARARPVTPQYQKVDTAFSNALTAALHAKMSVSQALNQAASQADSLLAGG